MEHRLLSTGQAYILYFSLAPLNAAALNYLLPESSMSFHTSLPLPCDSFCLKSPSLLRLPNLDLNPLPYPIHFLVLALLVNSLVTEDRTGLYTHPFPPCNRSVQKRVHENHFSLFFIR